MVLGMGHHEHTSTHSHHFLGVYCMQVSSEMAEVIELGADGEQAHH